MGVGIVDTGVGPAAAVSRRVVVLVSGMVSRASPSYVSSCWCGHLGPEESGQLAGDGGDYHVAAGLAGIQAAEAAA
jgi:hypothetical protein